MALMWPPGQTNKASCLRQVHCCKWTAALNLGFDSTSPLQQAGAFSLCRRYQQSMIITIIYTMMPFLKECQKHDCYHSSIAIAALRSSYMVLTTRMLKAGKLPALAPASERSSVVVPGLPSVAEHCPQWILPCVQKVIPALSATVCMSLSPRPDRLIRRI